MILKADIARATYSLILSSGVEDAISDDSSTVTLHRQPGQGEEFTLSWKIHHAGTGYTCDYSGDVNLVNVAESIDTIYTVLTHARTSFSHAARTLALAEVAVGDVTGTHPEHGLLGFQRYGHRVRLFTPQGHGRVWHYAHADSEIARRL